MKNNALVWTGGQWAACGGRTMQIGKEWIVGGYMINGQLRISACGFARFWSDLTDDKREIWRRFLTDLTCPTAIMDFPIPAE